MTDQRRAARLTSDEVALVLRRAVEIETAPDDRGPGAGYDPVALEEAAREVGVSPAAVRQAVAELRVGALAPEDETRASRAARSRAVAHQRQVATPADRALVVIDRFMRTQMLELRRRAGDRSLYRPRSDLVASLRRGLDFGGAIKLEGLRTVDVVVTPTDVGALVRVEAELTASRANIVAGAATAGTAVTVTTGVVGALMADAGLVIAALPAGVLIGGGGLRVADARWRRRRDDVAEVLESLLDRL